MQTSLVSAVVVGAVLAAAGGLAVARAQEGAPGGQPQRPDLVGGLQGTKGCLGVETARTRGGKQVIFAWFEDKAAVVRWYYSETHQGVMDSFITSDEYGTKPLAHVADDAGPIMVVASLTPAEAPAFPDIDIPISQIAIELYQPLPGGAFLGGRFAPAAAKVAHMRDYTPPATGP